VAQTMVLALLAVACSPGEPTVAAETENSTTVGRPDQSNVGTTETGDATSETIVDPAGPAPDVIFHNGVVLTMDPRLPQAEAIAILDDKVLAVGSDDSILAKGRVGTQIIDLNGRTLVPGFIDSHAHWIGDSEWTDYEFLDDTIQYMIENGWTSVNEMFVSPGRLEKLQELDRQGRLRVRVNAYLPINFLEQRFGRPYLEYTPLEEVTPHVRIAGVKMFVDNDWGHIVNWTPADLNAEVQAAHQAGWQLAIHAFSVEGHSMTLDALALALQGESNEAYRHRIEHVVAVTDEQLTEIQERGYIASIQPNFPGNIPQGDPTFDDKVPEEDHRFLTRWQDMNQAGIRLVAGTDWPWFTNESFLERGGAPAGSPLRLIYKAATHTDVNNRVPQPWMDGQFLPVGAALRSLTVDGAYATFEEDVKGSLAPGRWADLVVLSDNPLTVPIGQLPEIDVLLTMIGGKVEYCAEGAENLCAVEAAHSD